MSVHHRAHRQRLSRERSAAAFALAALMAFIILMGMVIAVSFAPNPALLFGGTTEPSPGKFIESRIAGQAFHIPETLLARLDKPLLGETASIGLRIPWPYRPNENPAPEAAGEAFVMLSIAARGEAQTHEELYREIYPVYLEPDEFSAPFGFRRFRPQTPYALSELLIDARQAPAAVIRCDTSPSALGPVLCERLKPLGAALMVRMTFPKSLSADWRALDAAADGVLAAITPRAP